MLSGEISIARGSLSILFRIVSAGFRLTGRVARLVLPPTVGLLRRLAKFRRNVRMLEGPLISHGVPTARLWGNVLAWAGLALFFAVSVATVVGILWGLWLFLAVCVAAIGAAMTAVFDVVQAVVEIVFGFICLVAGLLFIGGMLGSGGHGRRR